MLTHLYNYFLLHYQLGLNLSNIGTVAATPIHNYFLWTSHNVTDKHKELKANHIAIMMV